MPFWTLTDRPKEKIFIDKCSLITGMFTKKLRLVSFKTWHSDIWTLLVIEYITKPQKFFNKTFSLLLLSKWKKLAKLYSDIFNKTYVDLVHILGPKMCVGIWSVHYSQKMCGIDLQTRHSELSSSTHPEFWVNNQKLFLFNNIYLIILIRVAMATLG